MNDKDPIYRSSNKSSFNVDDARIKHKKDNDKKLEKYIKDNYSDLVYSYDLSLVNNPPSGTQMSINFFPRINPEEEERRLAEEAARKKAQAEADAKRIAELLARQEDDHQARINVPKMTDSGIPITIEDGFSSDDTFLVSSPEKININISDENCIDDESENED